MRSTVLRLRNGKRVHITNTAMTDEDVIVYTTEQKRRTEIEIEVDARHPLKSVERVILDALNAVPEVNGGGGDDDGGATVWGADEEGWRAVGTDLNYEGIIAVWGQES